MYQDPEVGTSQMWKIETIEMWNDKGVSKNWISIDNQIMGFSKTRELSVPIG